MTGVSVLLPTRGRPKSLATSVDSLLWRARPEYPVEILIGADPDDTATLEWPLPPGVTRWVAPERHGYRQLHLYYNHLAKMAGGEWLMLWNDDAIMLTARWNEIITAQEPAVLWPQANHRPDLNLFPAWPKAWSDALGHVSLCAAADSWMSDVGILAGRHARIPVAVFHDRVDVTGGHDDATAAEGTGLARSNVWPDVYRDLGAEREADAAILRGLIA